MSSNTATYGTDLHSNGFLIVPASGINTPIFDAANETVFPDYLLYDESDVIIGGMTIVEHQAANPNRKIMSTLDGLYFYYGMEIGFMKGSQKALKTIMGNAGLKIGKKIDDMAMNKYWVGNIPELNEWLEASPHNEPVVVP